MAIPADERRFLKRLGLRLRELREVKGWTLEETESHGWLNWRHLQALESGKNMTIITLRRAAKLYKISLQKLLSEAE
jgi:hypothetical protein